MTESRPRCPRCEAIELRRQGRSGFWQSQILCRLGFFPWECGQCRRVYLLRLRSFGYRAAMQPSRRTRLLDMLLVKDRL